ncbi:MAG TPA: PLP-dependent aminotransferase family protein [Streptosporangiaceae bacterium]|jgi:2-aminoadipate transaminase|nr:PLP-dependent aminotransferase family protein [Streptosporangiaceae bacterium]
MTAALDHHDWSTAFARRTKALGGGEITAILALAGATEVITFSGGFPDPETFPREILSGIVSRLVADDAHVALQYSPTEGLPGPRDFVSGRLEAIEGLRPASGELMITSGGIDCMELVAKSFLDPGDVVLVEAPTYLGAIMAFRGYEADVRGVAMDDGGMRVDVLADMLGAGLRPKMVYTIPDYQNPTGLSMTEQRRAELVRLARHYGFLILEDVAYRELGFGTQAPSSLWPLGPDVVVQAGTFSKIFIPGVRLGWAAGPAEVISALVVAKQNSDQCSGALGQRLLEEYGRGGHLDRQVVASRALYARRARLMSEALAAYMPAGTTWTTPHGGFYVWVSAPEGVDTVALAAAARDRQVAYVPGQPFYPAAAGGHQMRLAYSRVADEKIEEGIRRIGGVLRSTLEET